MVLVVAPTQEVTMQIRDDVLKFGNSSGVSCTCLYGNALEDTQLLELDRGPDIVVATPARLNDVLVMKKIKTGQVLLLVLDEVDRMLDMGFKPQIRKIVKEITPQHKQTLMYTATWSKKVEGIASDLLVNHVQVKFGSVDKLAENKAITQNVEVHEESEKLERLTDILDDQKLGSKVIIFCSTSSRCKVLCNWLRQGKPKFSAVAVHEGMSQYRRETAFSMFLSRMPPILVATYHAASVVDIKYVRVVINYDFPTRVEDYVRQIKRTRKAGATCVSYTFFSEQDCNYAADLIKYLEGAKQHVTSGLRSIAECGSMQRGNFGGSSKRARIA